MDEQTYLKCAAEYKRSLYRIAHSILENDAACAEAVERAVFKGWQRRWRLRDQEQWPAWLTGILIRECRSVQRRAHWQGNIDDALGNDLHSDDAPPAPDKALEKALQALPVRYRLPVLLYDLEGFSVTEIAQMLGLTERRVSSRLIWARQKIAEALKHEEPVEHP